MSNCIRMDECTKTNAKIAFHRRNCMKSISIIFTQVYMVCILFAFTHYINIYIVPVELVSLISYLTTRLLQIFLTCLICFISTNIGTNVLLA